MTELQGLTHEFGSINTQIYSYLYKCDASQFAFLVAHLVQFCESEISLTRPVSVLFCSTCGANTSHAACREARGMQQ